MPEMPTWQILPTTDGHFRWVIAGQDSDLRQEIPVETLDTGDEISRLTSMADLFLQARPNILEDSAGAPMFRTGLGRSVTVSERSIKKGRSLVEGGDERFSDGCGAFPMFRTGSGKTVSVKESSIQKATVLLEGDVAGKGDERFGDGCGVFPMFQTASGKRVTVMESSIQKATTLLEGDIAGKGATINLEDSRRNEAIPMFQTGSGKPVTVRGDSIRKAVSVLEIGAMRKGSGKRLSMRRSSSQKAATVLEGEGVEKGFENSLEGCSGNEDFPVFRTGSGKPITVRQDSLKKAISVLEGEATMKKEEFVESTPAAHFPILCTGLGKELRARQSPIEEAEAVPEGEDVEKERLHKYDANGEYSFSGSLFQTCSGKAVNISSDGLSRATTLLGLEGNDISAVQIFGLAGDKLGTRISPKWENSRDRLWRNVSPRTAGICRLDPLNTQMGQREFNGCSRDFGMSGNQSFKNACQISRGSEVPTSDSSQPPIRFHTAGGSSISISNNALQRARGLLGDSELEVLHKDVKVSQPLVSVPGDDTLFDEISRNKENIPYDCFHEGVTRSINVSTNFSHLQSSSDLKQSAPVWSTDSQRYILNQVNTGAFLLGKNCVSSSKISYVKESLHKDLCASTVSDTLIMPEENRIPGGPLVEISNHVGADHGYTDRLNSEKRRLGRRNSISPFKRPRYSRFITPLNSSTSFSSGASTLSTIDDGCRRTSLSAHFPFEFKRKKLKEFFGGPPPKKGYVPDDVKHMIADNAAKYKFHDASGFARIGVEAFQNMLLQSGASLSSVTKEWVENHYKWIVWKLACLERSYPAKASGKYLTISTVLEELKYRYEREVNYGHRSTIKKILEGDASPASMMVLCVSAIRSHSDPKTCKLDDKTDIHENSEMLSSSTVAESNHAAKIELTDGWYSLDCIVDVLLSKQLLAGKLFVGQKLRICGASLRGWVGPISFAEVNTVSLLIHMNGTYRARWDEPLGFCKGLCPPLAFRCIKGSGGKVPRTLVGVARIYPLLYKERFPTGESVVRSERTERRALQLYQQRRSNIADDIIAEQPEFYENINDSDEGAKICKILESAAEPEVIMAGMSAEQLMSFASYKAKQKAVRQSDTHKKIDKALQDAGLSSREVTPFVKVRVVGLNNKISSRKIHPREGIITIWNPTEKQKIDLVEGQIYSVTGLTPLNYGTDVLYLQGRGSSTQWKPLPFNQTGNFELSFTPRKAVLLSNLGEVPLAREFDIAAVVLHVGDVYISGHQKKQWIFMTDGSQCTSEMFEELYDCLLAVSFCSPIIDNDLTALFNHALSGTIVGFCNLVKRARDQINHIWVAEATEISTYCASYNLPGNSHLKEAADSNEKWAKVSYLTLQKLRERVLSIVGVDRRRDLD
ncbi:protein BREAST CANCER SUSCEPTIBILITY 2 homolog B-like isoform X2 [Typha angustifolia]|uniref:protein BREAST CANCER SUSCEPTIBILITY 2 homolog B-like isoform X2 n=1 Tax=Typha angustifolia TaxID=59011 RepID=UPI003C2F732F